MMKAEKQAEFAGRKEQSLPGSGAVATIIPADSFSTSFVHSHTTVIQAEKEPAAPATVSPDFLAATLPALNRGLEAPARETTAGLEGARRVEQMFTEINRHAVEFRHFNADSMAVVLKLDARTEILLQLVQRDGIIEVNARFDRGDFQALNGQWGQLQQSLATQGIRIGSLHDASQQNFPSPGGGGNNFTFHDGNSRQQQERQQPAYRRDEPAFAGASADTSRARSRRAVISDRRLETWA